MVIGGKLLQWPSGRNYFGNIVVGDNSTAAPAIPNALIGRVLETGCNLIKKPSFIDFAAAGNQVKSMSGVMATWASTALAVNIEFGTMTV